MAKLARENDESTFFSVGNGMVSKDAVSAMVKLARGDRRVGVQISSVTAWCPT